MKRRVVVTGLGAITPVGNDVAATWRALLAGTSGAAPITKFDPTKFPVRFACEVKGFDPLQYMDRKEAKRADLVHAVRRRRRRCRRWPTPVSPTSAPYDPDRIGVIVGSGIGGLQELRGAARRLSRARREQDQPVLHPDVHRRHRGRHRVHALQRARVRTTPRFPPAPRARTRSAMRSARSSTATPTS